MRKLFRSVFLASVFLIGAAAAGYSQAVVSITNKKDACNGLFNGSFTIEVVSGVPIPGPNNYGLFVFGLSFGQIFSANLTQGVPLNITGLRSDTYIIAISDGDPAPNYSSFLTINNIATPLAVSTDIGFPVNNSDCSSPTGQIRVTASGGSGTGYTYSWTADNGFTATTDDISNLAGGNYSLLVSDNGTNCTVSLGPITITDPSPAAQSITTPSPTTVCVGDGITINLANSEVFPVTYEAFVNGVATGISTNGTGAPISLVLPSGTFGNGSIITVRATNGACTPTNMNGAVNVIIQTLVLSNTTTNNTRCIAPFNGAIDLTLAGTVNPVTYSWVGPGGFTASTQDITAIQDGTYTVTVLDNVTLCNTSANIVVANATPTITLNSTTTGNTRCVAPFNGSINLTVTGSIGVPTFSWTGPGGFTASTEDISLLENGDYTVIVTDPTSGCTATTLITVADSKPVIGLAGVTVADTRCIAPFNGSINLTVTGALGVPTYSWTGPSGFTATTEDISAVDNGNYTITVTDPVSGCVESTTFTVNDAAPALTLSSTITDNTRCLAPFNGGIDIAIGGSAGPFTFSWSGPGGFTAATEDITALQPGSYTVQVTETASGCIVTDVYVVADVPPTISVTAVITDNTRCLAPFNGAIDITPAGSAGPFTFSWTGPGGFTSTSEDVANEDPGVYTVTITETASGCTTTANFTILDTPPTLTLTTNITDNTRCAVPFNGAIDITVNGSVGPFAFAWTGPSGFTSTSEDISTLAPGNYSILVTDTDLGCTVTANITVADLPPTLTLTNSVTNNSRCIAPFNGAIDLSVAGSAGPFSYAWNGPSGFTAATQDISTLLNGNYSVTVTDLVSACTAVATITVNNVSPTITATTAITTNSRCVAPYNGAINLTPAGSAGPFTFAWTGPGGFTANTEDISTAQDGNYAVVITDVTSGCTASVNVTIGNSTPTVILTSTSTANTNCVLPNNGAINLTIGGTATGPFTISWSGPGGFVASVEDISALEPGNYSVTVTDNISGCSSNANVTVADTPPVLGISSAITNNTRCIAPFNGALNITVTGATGALTFSWTGPGGFTASTEDITALQAGSYTVLVTDVNTGCTSSSTISVNDVLPALILTSAITNNTNCVAPLNGAINLSVAGSAGPFTFAWTGPSVFTAATEDITALDPGTYTILVTETASGCTATANYTVLDTPPTIVVTNTTTPNSNCVGPFNGAVNISVAGGTGPYTFAWTGPGGFTAVTEDISALNSGSYDVTVTETATGCSTFVTIAVPSATPTLTITSAITDNTNCVAPFNGAINISVAGGSGTYTYAWAGPSAFTSTTEDIAGREAGFYTVTVTDAVTGCTGSASPIINDVLPVITITNTTTDNVACLAPFTGSVNITVAGGTGPFTFAWTGPGGFTAATEDIATLDGGTYDVLVTDQTTGCTANASIVVNNNTPTIVLTSTTVDNTSCVLPGNGSVNLSVAGGAGPLTYSWTGPSGFTATTEDINSLVGGVYDVTVTDANGCQQLASITVNTTVLTFTVTQDLLTDNSRCALPFDGAISVTAAGGTGVFSYAWSGPGGFTSTSEDLTALQDGVYTLITTDLGTSCTVTSNFTINLISPTLTLTGNATDNTRCVAPFDGTIDLVVAGSAGPFTYAWTGPGGFVAGTEDIASLDGGTYDVTVTDVPTGCTTTASILVVTSTPTLTPSATFVDNTKCVAPYTGSINLTVAGSAGPFTYAWTGPGGFTSSIEDPATLQDGNYDVTITESASGCTTTFSVTVGLVTPVVTATPTITSNTKCLAPFNGAIILNVAPVGSYSYSWTGPGGFTASTRNITSLAAGVYFVDITDIPSGCVYTNSYTVLDNSPLITATLDVSVDNTVCTAPFDGALLITAGGGSGLFTYAWTGPNGFTSTIEDPSNLENGAYTVVVTDVNLGCTVTANFNVLDATPVITLATQTITDNTNCVAPFNGAITVTAGGTPGPFTFAWTGPSGFTGTGASISALAAGNYTVTITDTFNGCSDSYSLVVNDNLPVISIATDLNTSNTACVAPFNGALSITPSGTSGPYTYAWTGPGGFTSTLEDITQLSPGTYTVIVTDSGTGCTGTTSIDVLDNSPVITVSTTGVNGNTACIAPFNGDATVLASGTAGPFTYSWTGPNGFTGTGASITGLESGNYTVIATDQVLGCTGTLAVNVPDNTPVIAITSTIVDNTSCQAPFSGAISLTSITGTAGPYTFAWTGPGGFTSTLQDITALDGGSYDVIITDSGNGCSAAFNFTVNQALPVITVTPVIVDNTVCVAPFNGSISLTALAGTPGPYTFSWTGPGGFTSTNQDITALNGGSYSVTITDALLGCQNTYSFTVNQTSPVITVTPTIVDNTTCAAPFTGSITLSSISGSPGPFTFAWTGPGGFTSTNQDITALEDGDYDVTITDASSGCVTLITYTVGDLTPIPTTADARVDQTNCLNGTFTLAGNVPLVGTGLWSIVGPTNGAVITTPSSETSGVTGLLAGQSVTLRWTISSGACPASTDDVVLRNDIAPTVANAGANQTTCGTSTFLAANNPVVGIGQWSFVSNPDGLGVISDVNDRLSGFTGTTGQIYTLAWTITNGVCVSSDQVTITYVPVLTTTSIITNNSSCATPFDGAIDITPVGSAGPFTYAWTGPSGFTAATEDITGLDAGSYSVTITYDVLGCSVVQTYAVTNTFTAVTASLTSFQNNTNCNAPYNGALIVTGGGTPGPFTYAWTGPGGFTAATASISNLSPGAYTVTVTDPGVGCSTTSTFNVLDNAVGCLPGCFAFTVSVTDTRPTCSDRDDGIIQINVSGGNPGYIITLTDSLTFNQALIGAGPVFTFANLSPKDYYYIIQDASGRVCAQPYSLPRQTNVLASIDPTTIIQPLCFEDPTASLVIEASSSATGEYYYSIDGVSWNLFIPGNRISGLPSIGAYTIEVGESTSDPCRVQIPVVINAINVVPISFVVDNTLDATCNNNDGELAVNAVTGGSGGPYSFALDNGTTTTAFQPSNVFSGLAGGSYTVIVRDVNGCTNQLANVVVDFPGFTNYTVTPFDADCSLDGYSGKLSVQFASAGTYRVGISTDPIVPPVKYRTYATFDPVNDVPLLFDSLSRGTYYVFAQPSGAACPTRRGAFTITGAFALSFDVVTSCTNNEVSIALTNITGEAGIPFSIKIYKKFGPLLESIDLPAIPSNGSVALDYASHVFLQTPAEYEIQLEQTQSFSCSLKSPITDYEVQEPLNFVIAGTIESYPDINTGSMTINNFNGGLIPYEIRIELDSAAVGGAVYETNFEVVTQNSNLNFESIYTEIPAGRYLVQVMDGLGCVVEKIARVPLDTDIFIPNIFTPNDDEYNEVFYIRNLPLNAASELVITNRWGKEIYSSSDYKNDWKAIDVPEGIYYYKLKVAGGDSVNGWVEIIRGIKP